MSNTGAEAALRKLKIVSLVATMALVVPSAHAAGEKPEHELIAGHELVVDSPYHKGMIKFAELVEQKTDGRVKVTVHPNAELGGLREMFQGLQQGTLDVAGVAPGSVAEFVPEMSILSMPFLITSREQRDQVIHGPVGSKIAELTRKKTGVVTMGYFGGGIRNAFFNKPVKDASDMNGRTFRVQPSRMLAESWKAAGLRPVVIAYSELYNALAQGVVDGAENESVYIISQKFYEAAKHLVLTQHEVVIRPQMISQRTLDRLGPELSALVMAAGKEAGDFQRVLEEEQDDAALLRLEKELGMTITKVDTSGIIERVLPVWRTYAKQWGLEKELEQIIDAR